MSTLQPEVVGAPPSPPRASSAARSLIGACLGMFLSPSSVLLISFGLYLVHEPILLGARIAGERLHLPVWVALVTTLLAAVLVAQIFTSLIDRPFQRLARSLGRRSGAAARAFEVGRIDPAPALPLAADRPLPLGSTSVGIDGTARVGEVRTDRAVRA